MTDQEIVTRVLRRLGKIVKEVYLDPEKREEYLTIGDLKKLIEYSLKKERADERV